MRVYVQDHIVQGVKILINKEKSRHVLLVMRKKAGDDIIIFNASSGEWKAKIEIAEKNSIIVTPQTLIRKYTKHKNRKLHLLFSPVKSYAPSFIAEKATELGVCTITPIITERTIVRKVNLEKISLATIAASEQSGRIDVPVINEALSLKDAIAIGLSEYTNLFFLPQSDTAISDEGTFPNSSMKIFIGPEGGFSPKENQIMQSCAEQDPAHNKIMTLGPNILRAETAAIAAIATATFTRI